MWDKPPFLLRGAQAQHGAVGSEVLIRDIPGLSGIRPGNPILAGATSFARGSDQKERVACESCVQGTVCRNRFRSPSSPDGRVGLGVSRIRPALSQSRIPRLLVARMGGRTPCRTCEPLACERVRSPESHRTPDILCEPYRELIVEALSRGRNAMAIWQDLVDDHGFPGRPARSAPPSG